MNMTFLLIFFLSSAFAQADNSTEVNSIKEHSIHAYEVCQEEINKLKWIELKKLESHHV